MTLTCWFAKRDSTELVEVKRFGVRGGEERTNVQRGDEKREAASEDTEGTEPLSGHPLCVQSLCLPGGLAAWGKRVGLEKQRVQKIGERAHPAERHFKALSVMVDLVVLGRAGS